MEVDTPENLVHGPIQGIQLIAHLLGFKGGWLCLHTVSQGVQAEWVLAVQVGGADAGSL